ncbi:MAG: potassium channel protein [Candidatus Eremiobacteraeota bacterium]|nr:potassium channel protein [Candidatus Eremiobacteraeota bacterium]
MQASSPKKIAFRNRYADAIPIRRVRFIFSVLAAVLVLGTIGFKHIENLTWIDALYMTVITLATVGFGEVKPFTPAGRIFTIFLILGGVGLLTYAVESLILFMSDPNFAKYLKAFSVDRKVNRMENHFIICGLGRVGSHVAEELAANEAPFVCIEHDTRAVDTKRSRDWVIIEGDATDDEVLYMAGITRAKGLICTMDSDVNNLYVTLSARAIRGDITIITRVVDDSSTAKFQKAGASQIISPYTMLGKRIARSVLKPSVDTMIDLALNQPLYDFHLEEIQIEKCNRICGLSVKRSGIKSKTGASIVSIVKTDGTMVNNPSPDELIEHGDTLIMIGTSEQLRKMKEEILGP